MAESGNRLGSKTVVTYVTDAGVLINLQLDTDLIISNAGLSIGQGGQPKPLRFTPRGVFAQAKVGSRTIRKFLVCGTSSAALFATNLPQSFTIDGLVFTTTGRKGERQSFIGNGEIVPSPGPET